MREKKILWIITFNLIIIFSEILFGIISNSFALIADALHNAGDVIAIVITYIALKLGTKQTTFKYTFGFLRSEMMAAFVNTLFLSITMIYMIYQAVYRFFNPEIIEPLYMIIVGTIAVIANGISAYLLNTMNTSTHTHHEHHHEHRDANIKSAYLHMLSDALISVGVVTAGIFIYFFRIYYIDSILTIVFSLYILRHSYPLLKKSFLSLMDTNITDISPEELDKVIKIDDNIIEYHDLHIYKPSSKYNFISFHIVLKNNNLILKEIEEMTGKIKHNLKKYDFNHILIQVDTDSHIKHKINCELKE
ncbi:cation diffusion facilitator family transporter [Psychrilyobacter atlanticus]|uniref:cation diffusion facilitator family transporter n=1 Tax=Psychrilyobacter atlanticus TaxID=271091 RepID=UPI000421E400|nr:cation diffusion facilitator family transporter [Psychrilyobacter atlanticus]